MSNGRNYDQKGYVSESEIEGDCNQGFRGIRGFKRHKINILDKSENLKFSDTRDTGVTDSKNKGEIAGEDGQENPGHVVSSMKKYDLRMRSNPTKAYNQQPTELPSNNDHNANQRNKSSSSNNRARKKRKSSEVKFDKRQDSLEEKDEVVLSEKMNNVGDEIQIHPFKIDEKNTVSFDDIGGLSKYVNQLKDMFSLPLKHAEFLSVNQIRAPRGVLLCGPPGTGKTLIVRALASSFPKVTLYMIKCSDILSKWVGESERQLKGCFEEAKKNQPSILFFDEIDGLAPVRSSSQEQVHNSIVSTLLSLMEGLDDRGDVVLIGATNRIDDVDGALRRPGRFDRELNFPLPDREARVEILTIHTRKWKFPPSDALKNELAQTCAGYCGADLKALCTEAAILAFRQIFPHDNDTIDNKLTKKDYDSVIVERHHFLEAISEITPPASRRGSVVKSRQLSTVVEPCLGEKLKEVMLKLAYIFPYQALSLSKFQVNMIPLVHKPRFLLCGTEGVGLEHLGPAILYQLEKFPVHSLEYSSLALNSSATHFDDSLLKKFSEAKRSAPSIIYIPRFHVWWGTAEKQLKSVLVNLVEELPADSNILILGTSNYTPDQDDPEINPLSVFPLDSVYEVDKPPSRNERKLFFEKMIETAFSMQSLDKSRKTNNTQELQRREKEAVKKNINLQENERADNMDDGHRVSGSEAESKEIRNDKEIEKIRRRRKRKLKNLFIEQTKDYNVERLERLHSRLMASITLSNISKGNLVHSGTDILSLLLEFIHHKDDEDNFGHKKSGRDNEFKVAMDVEVKDGDKQGQQNVKKVNALSKGRKEKQHMQVHIADN